MRWLLLAGVTVCVTLAPILLLTGQVVVGAVLLAVGGACLIGLLGVK